MNWRKLALVLTCIGAVIWYVHQETGLDALPKFKVIDKLHAASAHTGYENGLQLANIKIIKFEGEQLTKLETIISELQIRRETLVNRVNKGTTSEYSLTIVTGEKEYRLHIEDTNRIVVHADRAYIMQNDALVDFLKERFRSEDVYGPAIHEE